MKTSDAASLTKEFPSLSKSAGPAPAIKTKVVDADGAITGDDEELGMLHAPDPVGHFMLVALPKVELSKLLITPDSVTDRERAASVIGTVMAMGPDCYQEEAVDLPEWIKEAVLAGSTVNITTILPRKRFRSPWCKIGDTVLFSRYAGKRFKIEGIEFRMLADDEITATIPDGAKVGGL